ncbi:nose resistant to fluoxetine protein 6-like [Periplaneta americana]|uniref:nose resistant to fluoxetine protein 6-like n=1 Tax=Periplaneta americana TaxID=6978 RepID=UPI0037E79D29
MGTNGVIGFLDGFLSPHFSAVPGERCRNDSMYYEKNLQWGTSWAMKMWDSAAKLQSGLLTGNLHSLGNFDECVGVTDVRDEKGSFFNGQYCLATINMNDMSTADAMGQVLKQVIEEEEEINVGLGALLSKGLRWGYCVPSSCTAEDVTVGLTQYLGEDINATAIVNGNDCHFEGTGSFSFLDYFAMVIFGIIFITVLFCTGYEWLKERAFRENARREEHEDVPQQPPETVQPENVQEPGTSKAKRPQSLDLPAPEADPPATPPAQMEGDAEGQNVEIVLKTPDDVTPVQTLADADRYPWAAFSLVSNFRKLFSFDTPDTSLPSLYALRFLSVCWVLVGHTVFIQESLPTVNYVGIKQYTSDIYGIVIIASSLAVDTFVLITGVLMSYLFLKDMKKRGIYRRDTVLRNGFTKKFLLKYIPLFYLHRLVRILPTLALLMLLHVTLLGYLGSGPFWNSGHGYIRGVCEDTWWGTLLLIQNWINPERICVTHSWYLMVDMQLHLIAPIFLVLLVALERKQAHKMVFSTVLLAMICSFLVNSFLGLQAGYMTGDLATWNQKIRYDIMALHTRIPPLMIGMSVGYLFHNHRHEGKIRLNIAEGRKCCGWLLTCACMFFSVFALLPFQQLGYSNHILMSLYSSVCHTVWALGIAFIIVVSESNNGGIVQTVLSWKMFQPLGRLTFCFYLVHLPLMMYRSFTVRVPVYFSLFHALSSVFGDVLFSTLLAIVLSLFVEMPFIRLFRYFTLSAGFPLRKTRPLAVDERTPLIGEIKQGYRTLVEVVFSRPNPKESRTDGATTSRATGASPVAQPNGRATSSGTASPATGTPPGNEEQ